MGELCTDGRFEVISKAKEDLLRCTNIETSPNEMAVLNDTLFRCWQMGWLDRYGEYGQAEWLMRHIDEYKKYEVVCSKCGVRYIGNYDAYDEPCEFRYCPECGREITCVVILPKEGDKE